MCCISTDTGDTPVIETANAPLQNERGVILIVVLVMLLLLSVLGLTVLSNTTSELRIAGNHRNFQEAFFNADGSLEQAIINNDITSDGIWDGFIYMNSAGLPVAATTLPAGTTAVAQIHSEFLNEGKPPRGSGFDDSTVATYYDVDVVGYGPSSSEVAIDAGIVKFR